MNITNHHKHSHTLHSAAKKKREREGDTVLHTQVVPSTLKILLAAGTMSSRCEAALSRSKQSQSGSMYKTITSMCAMSMIATSEMYIETGAPMIAFMIDIFDNDTNIMLIATYHDDEHI